MKVVAALLLLIAAVLSVTACDDTGGTSTTDTGPHGVIFLPPMNPGGPMMPIFY
ncbi:membrane protein [Mycobacterium phage MA5]|uniref:Membrane protein n=1 Tax=Mycobacterium phage MA5 TaxID=2725640 RepID=A0A6M3TAP6_9CAUD|nr:membrane protein [Mycobacterium phage MA5]QJD52091.1 membrane protein [Mycobacterium phage MA5]